MMICLIRAGLVLIRSEIWKSCLIARDDYTLEVMKTFPKRSKGDKKDDPAFQDEPLPSLNKKQTNGISSVTKSFKSKKERKEG